MSRFITKILFLFILFISFSLQNSITQIHFPHSETQEEYVYDGLREKSPGTTDEMLQFAAGGHILGFRKGDVFIASGDHVLRIKFLNARSLSPVNEGISPDKKNDLQGAKPLGRVSYSDLWDGVTLVYERHSDGVVKSTYTVQPGHTVGTNPVDRIRLRYSVPVTVDDSGNLVISFETGEMKESRPKAWQEIGGEYIPVEVSFRSLGERKMGFKVGPYDPHFPLVIDPVLSWNSFMGSSSEDKGYAIAVDGSGNVYVAGYSKATWGSPVNPHSGSSDAFAAKLNSSGVLQWNTFMGASSQDKGMAIAVDGSGNVYVAGDSNENWGTPVNPHSGGYYNYDAFAAKLNSSGVRQWHTFMGSSDDDHDSSIVVDGSGNVYVGGYSHATWGSPVNPHSGRFNYNAFAAKLNPSGVLQWNTFMGSAGTWVGAIALDGSGNVYVGGYSLTTWGSPVNPHSGGSYDVFAAKLNGSGERQWNTFMGSSDLDQGMSIAVDGSGNVYVAGNSHATWGTPVNPYSGSSGSSDVFAAKLNGSGVRQWHTFMGSSNADFNGGITVDGSGNVYVAGDSDSTWGTPFNPHTGGDDDAFAAKLNSSGVLQWHTFMGSADDDNGKSIAVDGSGNVYVAGYSEASWGSPVNPHAVGYDAFAAKISVSSKDDFLGTWAGQGVYYRNSDTGLWVKLGSPATMIVAGDLDGDGIDDLIGIWPGQGGVWVKYNSSDWALLSSTADWIGAGDMNGDGRCDLLGTWAGQGVYYRNSDTGLWVKMATPATQIAGGDFDADIKCDLVGIWPGQGGVWVKYSSTDTWAKLSSTADWIGAGDMNGDGKSDLLGTWAGQGVFFRDSESGSWVKMATPASKLTAGDIDGDGSDDLIGIWPAQGGVWVKYSNTSTWDLLSSTADWIAAGKMRSLSGDSVAVSSLDPYLLSDFEDLSSYGPGGINFVAWGEGNLVPQAESHQLQTTSSPGEPGFRCIEQKNLVPGEKFKKKEKSSKIRDSS